ncbi:MAG: hypothetical protein LC775_02305, partial [Acidobacteria bacterium]|nr:hypothetical protein [Acidobacteriota bacterium]
LEGVIVKALKDFEPDLAEAAEGLAGRVAVIDGSLHPCWSWKDKKVLWSGKHTASFYTHGCQPATATRTAELDPSITRLLDDPAAASQAIGLSPAGTR